MEITGLKTRLVAGGAASPIVAVRKTFNVRFRIGEAENTRNVGGFAGLMVQHQREA